MEKSLIDEINLDDIKESLFDIEELINEVNSELIEYGLLKSLDWGGVKNIDYSCVNGEFKDKIWAIEQELCKTYCYFDFRVLENLRFKGVNKDDILMLKCWVGASVIEFKFTYDNGENEFRNVARVRKNFNNLVDFIERSNNFSEEFLNESKGSNFKDFLNEFESNYTIFFKIKSIISYINFALDNVKDDETFERLSKYLVICKSEITHYSYEYNAREIPKSKNIILFADYIDKFINDNSIHPKIKLYYTPIVIWWKITSIIPIRPSEITTKLLRNALITDDENCYLKINRVKSKSVKKYLPLLRKIKITNEIYDLLSKYISDTEIYGESETLFSYKATKKLREEINKENISEYFIPDVPNSFEKINENFFTRQNLDAMRKRFYKHIIKGLYKDIYIDEYLRLGDTRHIAFTSLMLQGYSPVEIAIIGGHRTLSALDNYTCSTNSYIDTQVISIIRNNIKLNGSDSRSIIDDIFSNMPKMCPRNLEDCTEAYFDDIQLGYCIANFKENLSPCEDEDCHLCSKWWCEPNEYNYRALENVLKNQLKDKNDKLKRDIEFIMSILKDTGIDVVDGQVRVNTEVAKAIRRVGLELNSNTNDMIHLKYKLIDPLEGTYRLLSDLEELLPTEQINEIIKQNVIDKEI